LSSEFYEQKMNRLVTKEAYTAFAERGYIRLPGFLPSELAEPVLQRVQQVLARTAPSDSVTAIRKRLKPLARLPEFSALVTSELRQCASELADGRALSAPLDRPQLLFTPPGASIWTVPHKVWHLDVPRLGEVGLVDEIGALYGGEI